MGLHEDPQAKEALMYRQLFIASALIVSVAAFANESRTASAQTAKGTAGDAAKISQAMKAGPADITKNATVVEMDEKGGMKQLRAGNNTWTCMLLPAGPGVSDAMCADPTWKAWGDAYMAKKSPQVKTMGLAYMLQGDHGGSNTDPFATQPTATNQWVVAPPHVMVLVPDPRLLDSLPTDPHAGGAWVMYKGTPYAHIMVPLAPVPASKPAR